MSTRTVVEIHHDHLNDLLDAKLMRKLKRDLSSGEALRNLQSGFYGHLRILGQRHHSETLMLEVK